jgi:hypothetical protein
MKNEIKTKVVNGERYFFCDEENEWFPQYIEENGLNYELDTETFTYLPMVILDDEEDYDLGMWGLRRLEYLKSERPGTYTMLMIKGLWEHLVEIDKAANELEDRIVEEMCKAEGVTEELKANNQSEWVGRMNNVKNRAREVVYNELIYM